MVCAPLPIMAVDEETTGLNQDRSGRRHDRHSIAQIGAVDLLTNRSFYGRCRIRDGAEVDIEALAVNGITMDELTDPSLPTEAQLLEAFSEWSMKVKGDGPSRLMGGINPRFDHEFLGSSARHAGMSMKQFPFGRRTMGVEDLCTAESYSRAVPIPDAGYNTDKCYLLLGLPCEPKPHNAYVGALFGARCLDELMPTPGSARHVEPPTLFGVDRAPDCPNPFLVESLRRKFDVVTNLLVTRGGPTAELALLDIPVSYDRDGRKQCANPSFRAHYEGLCRLAAKGVSPAHGYAFTLSEMMGQAEAVSAEWARMDQALKAVKERERAPAVAIVSEAETHAIGGLTPPCIAEPAPQLAAPLVGVEPTGP